MDCDVVFGVCSVSASAQNSQRVRSWNGWVILFYFLEQLFVIRPYLEIMTSTSGSQALPLQVCASKLFFFWIFDYLIETLNVVKVKLWDSYLSECFLFHLSCFRRCLGHIPQAQHICSYCFLIGISSALYRMDIFRPFL